MHSLCSLFYSSLGPVVSCYAVRGTAVFVVLLREALGGFAPTISLCGRGRSSKLEPLFLGLPTAVEASVFSACKRGNWSLKDKQKLGC